MKKKDKQELRAMSLAQLRSKAKELHEAVAAEKIKLVSAELKNMRAVKAVRRKLAIALTVLREKELKGE